MLAKPELRQLRQRIVLRHSLRPFNEEETANYVEERLRLAGHTGKPIFKKAALREIHRVTGGTPRLINIVCDGALLSGFGRDQRVLGPEPVREVAADLGLETGGEAASSDSTSDVKSNNPPARKRRRFFGFLRQQDQGSA